MTKRSRVCATAAPNPTASTPPSSSRMAPVLSVIAAWSSPIRFASAAIRSRSGSLTSPPHDRSIAITMLSSVSRRLMLRPRPARRPRRRRSWRSQSASYSRLVSSSISTPSNRTGLRTTVSSRTYHSYSRLNPASVIPSEASNSKVSVSRRMKSPRRRQDASRLSSTRAMNRSISLLPCVARVWVTPAGSAVVWARAGEEAIANTAAQKRAG